MIGAGTDRNTDPELVDGSCVCACVRACACERACVRAREMLRAVRRKEGRDRDVIET